MENDASVRAYPAVGVQAVATTLDVMSKTRDCLDTEGMLNTLRKLVVTLT